MWAFKDLSLRVVLRTPDNAVFERFENLVVDVSLSTASIVNNHDALAVVCVRNVGTFAVARVERPFVSDEIPGYHGLSTVAGCVMKPNDLTVIYRPV